ncbi:hypothetical protein PG984_010728 [Apiospora sp. TS-2023a]
MYESLHRRHLHLAPSKQYYYLHDRPERKKIGMITGDAIYAIGRRQLADEAKGPFRVCHWGAQADI